MFLTLIRVYPFRLVSICSVCWRAAKRQPVDRQDRAHQAERPIWSMVNVARRLAEEWQA